jgi:hypothetical protein
MELMVEVLQQLPMDTVQNPQRNNYTKEISKVVFVGEREALRGENGKKK